MALKLFNLAILFVFFLLLCRKVSGSYEHHHQALAVLLFVVNLNHIPFIHQSVHTKLNDTPSEVGGLNMGGRLKGLGAFTKSLNSSEFHTFFYECMTN